LQGKKGAGVVADYKKNDMNQARQKKKKPILWGSLLGERKSAALGWRGSSSASRQERRGDLHNQKKAFRGEKWENKKEG